MPEAAQRTLIYVSRTCRCSGVQEDLQLNRGEKRASNQRATVDLSVDSEIVGHTARVNRGVRSVGITKVQDSTPSAGYVGDECHVDQPDKGHYAMEAKNNDTNIELVYEKCCSDDVTTDGECQESTNDRPNESAILEPVDAIRCETKDNDGDDSLYGVDDERPTGKREDIRWSLGLLIHCVL